LDYTISTASGKFYVGRIEDRHTLFGKSRAIDLEVNGLVKFTVEKNRMYVLDSQGKEHKLNLMKHGVKE
jgi:hypothetical protein